MRAVFLFLFIRHCSLSPYETLPPPSSFSSSHSSPSAFPILLHLPSLLLFHLAYLPNTSTHLTFYPKHFTPFIPNYTVTMAPKAAESTGKSRGWDEKSHEALLLCLLDEVKPSKPIIQAMTTRMKAAGYTYSYDAIKYIPPDFAFNCLSTRASAFLNFLRSTSLQKTT